MVSTYFLCIFQTVILSLSRVHALKCYKCIKEGCGHPFDAANPGVSQVECGGVCMTRTMTGFTSKQIEEMSPFKVGDVLRDCYKSAKAPGCSEEESGGSKGKACYCNEPLCNGGSDVTVSMAARALIMTTCAVILAINFG